MTIDTTKVAGRRELRFDSVDAILAEAERLVAAESARPLGNWSLGQILLHLGSGMEMSLDGAKHRPPWYVRIIGRLVKRRVLTQGLSPGINLPPAAAAALAPRGEVTPEEGLASLREAVRRMKRESHREPHPFFGKLTHQEWDQLHRRHAELHLSFVTLDEAAVAPPAKR